MLSLLASLTSYSQQYPETKIIDNQEVVIMTVQQADDINELFTSYEDSLKTLNEKIWRMGYDIRFANKQIEALDGTLGEVKMSNGMKDQQIVYYKEQMRRIDKLEWIDRKARVRVGIGIAGAILTWTALFILSK